jgi:phospholipase/lecithinase/hemolysin
MRLEGFLLIAGLSALSVPAAAWAAPLYSGMVVFGDSLSDTGNVQTASTAQGLIPDPPPPYFDGRLSNGRIWVDRLAERLAIASPSPSLLGGTNYAYAGAKTSPGSRNRTSLVTREVLPVPNIGLQIDTYLSDHPAGFRQDQLVTLWAGANDLVETRTAADTQQAVDNLAAALTALNANGARDVLVPNQIDQADAPIFNRTPGPAAQMAELNRLFNTQLDAMLDNLDRNPDLTIRIHRFDAFSLIKDVIDNPGEFGLSNVTDAALDLARFTPPFAPPYPVVETPEDYLFWDYVHPTTAGHRSIGDAAFDALAESATPVPEPPSMALVIIGIAGLLRCRYGSRSTRGVAWRVFCPLHRKPRSI